MKKVYTTKGQLAEELSSLKQRIAELEKSKAKLEQINEQLCVRESKYHTFFNGVKD